MGKVVEFKRKETKREVQVTHKLVRLADEMDELIMRHLSDPEMDPREIVGVLSHRLGSLMGHLEEKDELWYVCQQVLKRQAKID